MESETQNTQTVIGIIELGGTINSISQHSADEFYDGPNASINSLVEELSIQDNIKLVVEHFSQIISHEITPQTD